MAGRSKSKKQVTRFHEVRRGWWASVCLGIVTGLFLGGLTPWAAAIAEHMPLPDPGRTIAVLARDVDASLGGLLGRLGEHVPSLWSAPVPPIRNAQGFADCVDQFPPGAPVARLVADAAAWQPRPLCARGFATLYSVRTKTPLVVVERLDGKRLAEARDEERTDAFHADTRISPAERAQLSDYAGSGYDRGHMAPAADQPDPEAMAESFTLANIVPQDPYNNRKVWAKVESDVRHFARRAHGPVYVYTGPLFGHPVQTIGANAVWVPDRLFKLVYDPASRRAWAYVLPNDAEARVHAPLSYGDFTREAGWNLLEGLMPLTGATLGVAED